MKDFDIERKGYKKQDVDLYIENLEKQYQDKINGIEQERLQLNTELTQCKKELEAYYSKDDEISNALVVAVETAKEIESSAKTVYELEIKRVKVLYKKWFNILNEIKALYPDIEKVSGISILFDEFEEALKKILSKENEMADMPSNVNKTAEKVYAKTLLSRMWGNKPQNYKSYEATEPTKIHRADTASRETMSKRRRNAKSRNSVINNANILPIDGEGDFEKFLKSEFDDFDNYQYKKTHKDAQIDPDQKSNFLNVLEQNINNENKENNDEDKFDMLEALQPKEDLMDIMKSFNLDD